MAIANGKTAENTKRTVNENGIMIYGKIIDANTASEIGKKVIKRNKLNDKQVSSETTFTYSEYYSEAYGGTIILRTNNKSGR